MISIFISLNILLCLLEQTSVPMRTSAEIGSTLGNSLQTSFLTAYDASCQWVFEVQTVQLLNLERKMEIGGFVVLQVFVNILLHLK